MIVRTATTEDIPRIVEMSRDFYSTTSYAEIVDMADESAAGLAIITMETGVMLVAEDAGAVVGMVSLLIEPFIFNVSKTMAHELVWWIEPGARGGLLALRMLKAVEQACADRGADVIRMAAMANSPPQAAALYDRFSYAHSDSYYMKVL